MMEVRGGSSIFKAAIHVNSMRAILAAIVGDPPQRESHNDEMNMTNTSITNEYKDSSTAVHFVIDMETLMSLFSVCCTIECVAPSRSKASRNSFCTSEAIEPEVLSSS